MIKDWFESFSGNIYRRVTNPFLGTFVVVWLLYNWEVLFALFYFDDTQSFSDKMHFMQVTVGKFSLWYTGELILVTFIVLILTYLLLAISTVIASFYNKKAYPFIISKLDKGAIVMRDDYDRLQKRLNIITEQSRDLQNNNIALAETVDSQSKEIVELKSEQVEIGSLKDMLDNDESRKVIYSVLAELTEEQKVNYIRTCKQISSGLRIISNKDIKEMQYFEELGLINTVEVTNEGNLYRLTQTGEILYNYLLAMK